MKARKDPMHALRGMLENARDTGTCSIDEVATKSGVARSFVYRVVNGEADDVTISTLQALCDAVGAHPADVFGERKGAPKAVLAAWEAVGKWLKGK